MPLGISFNVKNFVANNFFGQKSPTMQIADNKFCLATYANYLKRINYGFGEKIVLPL